jgi:hypothetical protein
MTAAAVTAVIAQLVVNGWLGQGGIVAVERVVAGRGVALAGRHRAGP